MSSRIQSSKQGRELRNSRGRLPSTRTGLYELFQARMDTRRDSGPSGPSVSSGPQYRERSTVTKLESASTTSEILPITNDYHDPIINEELLKINEELKYQSEQNRKEIENLKTIIEQIRQSTPKNIPDVKDEQKLFYQELAYKLQMLENNIHHLEELRNKDPGDPIIVQHDLTETTQASSLLKEEILKLIEPIRVGLEQIEEDVLKEDDILDIVAGAVDPVLKNNEILKQEIISRMDGLQKMVDTNIKSGSNTIKKEEINEIITTNLQPIITDIKKIDIFDEKIKTVQNQINIGVDKSITLIESRINKLSDSIKSIPTSNVTKKDIETIEDTIKKLKEDIQSSRQSARNESAEREREITKEQKRIMDKVLEMEKKITGKELLKKPSSREILPDLPVLPVLPVKEDPVVEKEVLKNEVIYMTDDETKKRLAEIEEKLEAIQKKPVTATPARSITPIQRRSQSRERELDGHRLRDIPVFCAELRETMVVKGDVGPMPLINDTLWNIIADTTAGFDYGGGYYECPITGAYSINLICKTLSTSVTLKITLVHIDSTGHTLKAYSLDQSNMINEHSMLLRLPHTEKGDRLKLLVESRFNIALKGHEEIEVKGEKYPIVSTIVQIAYIPPVGFCET